MRHLCPGPVTPGGSAVGWVDSRAMKTTPMFIALLMSCPLMACSPLCERGRFSDPTEFVSGDGSFVVSCPGGARYTYVPDPEVRYYGIGGAGEKTLILEMNYRSMVPPNLIFTLRVPAELADGSYPLGGDSRITVDLPVSSVSRGNFSFQRTRDVAFADIEDPEAGEHISHIEFTLEMEGTVCRVQVR
jgi:hypothetical protein